MKKTEHLLIRIAEYGYSYGDGFLKKELTDAICPTKEELFILDKYFENSFESSHGHNPANLESPFFSLKKDYVLGLEGSVFGVKQENIFSYIDYLELQEARNAAMHAQKWATRAIWISIIAIIIQIITSFFPIEINKSQFNEIRNIISSEVNSN